MKHLRLALILGAVMALGLAGVASAHDVQSVSGTVACDGDYTITVHADVWLPTTLVVTLDGQPLSNPSPAVGSNHNSIDYVYTGTGASAGEVITARTSDESAQNGASGTLSQQEESCATPSPSPSPTPSPSPSPTPTASPPPTPSESPTPSSTPTSSPPATPTASTGPSTPAVTLPPTATAGDPNPDAAPQYGYVVVILLAGAFAGALAARRSRRSNWRDR